MQSKCPHCQTVLDLSPFAAGTVIACGNCQQKLTVPAPVPESESIVVSTAVTQRSTNRRQRRAKARAEERQIYGKLFAFVTVIAVVLGLFVMCSSVMRTKPLTPAEQAKKHADAQINESWRWAKWAVKQRLRSPSTADFGESVFSDTYQNPFRCVSRLKNNKYEVNGWVDAQNGFGATVRTRFTVVLKTTEDGLMPISVILH
jgi:hypothetical protein